MDDRPRHSADLVQGCPEEGPNTTRQGSPGPAYRVVLGDHCGQYAAYTVKRLDAGPMPDSGVTGKDLGQLFIQSNQLPSWHR